MKYIGSKARIAKHIIPIIQEYIDKSDKKITFSSSCYCWNLLPKQIIMEKLNINRR